MAVPDGRSRPGSEGGSPAPDPPIEDTDEAKCLVRADARAWVDEADPEPRGLPPEIADLVVLTVAAQCDHSLTRSGLAIPATSGKALPGDVILRPEVLPDLDTWRRAVDPAGHIFGSTAGAYVSGPEVGAPGDDIAAKAVAPRSGADRLVRAIESAYRRRGLDDGDRRRTARAVQAARKLLQDLAGASGAQRGPDACLFRGTDLHDCGGSLAPHGRGGVPGLGRYELGAPRSGRGRGENNGSTRRWRPMRSPGNGI